ncbi:MAG: DpnD/PcfM family protein [Bacteroidales bacterium]|jgi:hypothetical protein|nr:DpnD/PcfM family protein [Bacteroidales bacterium]
MEYLVEVKETLRRVIKVEAQNPEEAENMVEEKYSSCDIVLDAEDFQGPVTIKSIGLLKDKANERFDDITDYDD